MKDGARNINNRKVLALERYFYRRPNPNVVMAGRFSGTVLEEQLRNAILKIGQCHPLLRAYVKQLDDGNAFFATMEDNWPSIEVLEGEFTENDIIERAKEELKFRHPTDTGPLIRFIMFKSKDGFDLIVNSHHMICDGLSLYYMLRDLFILMGQPDAEVCLAEPLEVGKNLPSEIGLKKYHLKIIGRLNKSWAKKEITFDDHDHKELHNKFWNMERGLDIIHWELSSEQTEALIQRCRAEKITIHSALATAFLIAQREVQGRSRYLRNISMPVSIRNRLTKPAGEAFGLYYSSFKLEFKAPKGTDFWSDARAIHNHIQTNITNQNVFTILMQLKELHPTIIDSISFTRYEVLDDTLAKRFLKLEGGYTLNTGLDLSNIGVLDMPDSSGNLKFKGIVGPACYNEFQEKYTGVATLNGRLNFTITFCESRVSRETVEKLRDSAMSQLKKALAQ